jgi:tRNA dimethylallyltransferase
MEPGAAQQQASSTPLLLAGPTAVGKSPVAFSVAERVGGEIISVDSMQVYRGMDIGTAKPSAAERARVRHHLVDIVDLNQSFDAASFVRLAHAACTEIQSRGRTPIFCGGTGLYFKAYLQGLGEAPPSDAALRAELEKLALPDLLKELMEADPESYRTVDRANRRRVVRAVEVIRLTGKTFAEQRSTWFRPPPSDAPSAQAGLAIVGLDRPRADLTRRIDQRVDQMFASGLVEEVRGLLDRGLAENKTALQALGYRQVVEYLRGGPSLPDTIALVKQKTRQFAKRQMTWFRHQLPIHWLQVTEAEAPEITARRVLEAWRPTSTVAARSQAGMFSTGTQH